MIKMGWEHYQKVEPPTREPQVGWGLFGVSLLIFHFNFPNPSNLQHLIFYSILLIKISFPQCPKPQSIGYCFHCRDLVLLET